MLEILDTAGNLFSFFHSMQTPSRGG
jgi:hypothetical protein